MLFKIHLVIPKCLMIFKIAAIFKYNTLSKCKLSSILANYFLLVDYLLVKLINKETIKIVENCKYLTFK